MSAMFNEVTDVLKGKVLTDEDIQSLKQVAQHLVIDSTISIEDMLEIFHAVNVYRSENTTDIEENN